MGHLVGWYPRSFPSSVSSLLHGRLQTFLEILSWRVPTWGRTQALSSLPYFCAQWCMGIQEDGEITPESLRAIDGKDVTCAKGAIAQVFGALAPSEPLSTSSV